jgi:hypothetical protein
VPSSPHIYAVRAVCFLRPFFRCRPPESALPFRKTRSPNYKRTLEIDSKSSTLISSPMPRATAAALALALCLASSGSSFARSKSRGPRPPLDSDYISALAAANHFLQAWQMHDEERQFCCSPTRQNSTAPKSAWIRSLLPIRKRHTKSAAARDSKQADFCFPSPS